MAATWGGPSSSAGYWRGGMSDGPLWQGQGSYAYGPGVQGIGTLPPGTGVPSGKAWSPTLFYLFVFVVAEMIIFKWMEKMLR